MMSNWNDDDELMEELRAAVGSNEAVSSAHRDAARAAFSWRGVDRGLEDLLTLAHDSSLADEVLVRGAAVAKTRALAFRGAGFELEVELDGGVLLGQVLPGRSCMLAVRSADGTLVTTEVDDDGFFKLTEAPNGTVRFEVTTDDAIYATEWVQL
jgi:hypothetical protein